MAINVNNHEADKLTRQFAKMSGVSITDAIVIAMKEAIERRRNAQTPLQTAKRLRGKHGIVLSGPAREPLSKEAFDEMWMSVDVRRCVRDYRFIVGRMRGGARVHCPMRPRNG